MDCMRETLLELLLQAVSLAVYLVAGAVLAGLGALFEYQSYLFISSGEQLLAAWMAALGIVMLTFAYLIVRDKAGTAYGELRAS